MSSMVSLFLDLVRNLKISALPARRLVFMPGVVQICRYSFASRILFCFGRGYFNQNQLLGRYYYADSRALWQMEC
jgi:hypothetical protein